MIFRAIGTKDYPGLAEPGEKIVVRPAKLQDEAVEGTYGMQDRWFVLLSCPDVPGLLERLVAQSNKGLKPGQKPAEIDSEGEVAATYYAPYRKDGTRTKPATLLYEAREANGKVEVEAYWNAQLVKPALSTHWTPVGFTPGSTPQATPKPGQAAQPDLPTRQTIKEQSIENQCAAKTTGGSVATIVAALVSNGVFKAITTTVDAYNAAYEQMFPVVRASIANGAVEAATPATELPEEAEAPAPADDGLPAREPADDDDEPLPF